MCPVCGAPVVAVASPVFDEDDPIYPIHYDIVGWECSRDPDHEQAVTNGGG
jgi:hypothetical protein